MNILARYGIIPSGGYSFPASMIHEYLLDGDVLDSVGSNNGTANNITYVAGLIDQAASFNPASPSYITLDSLISETGAWSIYFIINIDDLSTTRGIMGRNRNVVTNTSDLFLNVNSVPTLEADTWTGNKVEDTVATSTIYIVQITSDGTTMKLYIGDPTTAVDSAANTVNLGIEMIGRTLINSYRYFDGWIQRIRYFDTELTQDERLGLWNGGAGR